MSLKLQGFLLLTAAAIASATPIAPCSAGTLTSYLNMSSSGESCSIGSLIYGNFQFAYIKPTTTSPSSGTISSDMILVSPSVADNAFSLLSNPAFDNTPLDPATDGVFNRLFENMERYFLNYLVDPPPIIAGDELTLDPPSGPVVASKWGCINSNFQLGSIQGALIDKATGQYSASNFNCLDSGPSGIKPSYFLQVTTNNFPSSFTQSLTFTEPATSVSMRLVLDFGTGTAITGLDAIDGRVTTIPEPATNFMIAFGLIGLGALNRSRRKR